MKPTTIATVDGKVYMFEFQHQIVKKQVKRAVKGVRSQIVVEREITICVIRDATNPWPKGVLAPEVARAQICRHFRDRENRALARRTALRLALHEIWPDNCERQKQRDQILKDIHARARAEVAALTVMSPEAKRDKLSYLQTKLMHDLADTIPVVERHRGKRQRAAVWTAWIPPKEALKAGGAGGGA